MLKNLVYFAVFTTFVVIVWIALGIYHSITAPTIAQDISVQVLPIKNSFDTKVISNLKTRQQIPVDLSSNIATPSASPIVTVTISPLPSQTPTPTASGSSRLINF